MTNKKIFFILFLLIKGTMGISQTIDDKPEFLGYRLGLHADSLPHSTYKFKQQKLSRHIPGYDGDTLRYEGILLKQVALYFFKGHLHSIDVKVTGEANMKLFLAKMRKLYGNGFVMDSFDSQVEWIGKNYALLYERNLITQDGIFTFYDYEVNDAYQKYLKELNAPKEVERVK